MKKFFSKALLIVFGLGVAATFTACHHDSSSSAPEQETKVAPKNSISGVILKADGTVLNGARVTINNQNVAVTGNEFAQEGLSNGSYEVVVTCNGYKEAVETVDLATSVQTVDGESVEVGQNVVKVFYLAENVQSTAQTIGSASTSDQITIEYTGSKDDDGNDINDTEENVAAQSELPEVTGTDYADIDQQIKDQSNGEEDITDYQVYLTNITSLEDAKAVARANRIAASRVTRATTAMPNNNELLVGVAVNAGPYKITLPGSVTFDITLALPDDVKAAVSLFRTKTGDSWSPLVTGDGIAAIDLNQPGKIVIKLNVIETQSFALGVIVNEVAGTVEYEDIVAQPIQNTTASSRTVTTMPYTIKNGVVLSTSTQGSLTDFLRKIVLRKYGIRAVTAAKNVTKTYRFTPAYSMHPYGVLYLQGFQTVTNMSYSVANSSASFTTREYGDAFVYPYEIWTEIEVDHTGGSN